MANTNHGLPATFKRRAQRVAKFCEANGWEIGRTKNNHIKLTHEVAGMVFFSGTTSDWRAEFNCICDLKKRMKEHNLNIK